MAADNEFAIFGELRREKLAFGGEKVIFWFGLSLVPMRAVSCRPAFSANSTATDRETRKHVWPGLLQLCVLRLRLLVDGNVGVSVFPEGEKILIGGLRLGPIALHGIGAGQLDMGERTNRVI